MKHKHAELMLMYAQDAMETNTPWEMWESFNTLSQSWMNLECNPSWHQFSQYRRKESINNDLYSKIKKLEDKLNSLDARVERLMSNEMARQQASFSQQYVRGG